MWIQADIQCRYDTTVLKYKSHKGWYKQSAENVGMTQQCKNKNLTKDDRNKLIFLHVYTIFTLMFTYMFTPYFHLFYTYVYICVYTIFPPILPIFTPCLHQYLHLCFQICVHQLIKEWGNTFFRLRPPKGAFFPSYLIIHVFLIAW